MSILQTKKFKFFLSILEKKSLIQALFFIFFIAITFLSPIFSYSWIYLNLFSLLLCSIHIYKNDDFRIHLPSTKIIIVFLLFCSLLILNSIANGSHFVEERWLMRYSLLFSILSFIIVPLNKINLVDTLKKPLICFILYVCFESIYQYIFVYTGIHPKSHSAHASQFQNISLYSQILLSCLPFVLFYKNSTNSKMKYLFYFLIFMISFNIFIGITRSVIIGLAILYLIDFYQQKHKFDKLIIFLILTFSVSTSYLATNYKKGYSTAYAESKTHSANYRITIWKKTIEIIQENPSGIGTNNFMFRIYSYITNEKISDGLLDLYYSPHDEFLRISVEEGIVIGVFYALIYAIIILMSFLRLFKNKKLEVFDILMLSFIPEFIFQFPSENVLPVFFFSFSLSELLKNKEYFVIKTKKYLLLFLSIFIFLNSTIWLIRNEKIIPTDYSAVYCSIFQDNWLMCKRYFADLYIQGDLKGSNAIIAPIIKRDPFNPFFISLDYSLGIEPRSSVLACMYFNLFNGELKIVESDTTKCLLEKDKGKMRNFFFDYSEKR